MTTGNDTHNFIVVEIKSLNPNETNTNTWDTYCKAIGTSLSSSAANVSSTFCEFDTTGKMFFHVSKTDVDQMKTLIVSKMNAGPKERLKVDETFDDTYVSVTTGPAQYKVTIIIEDIVYENSDVDNICDQLVLDLNLPSSNIETCEKTSANQIKLIVDYGASIPLTNTEIETKVVDTMNSSEYISSYRPADFTQGDITIEMNDRPYELTSIGTITMSTYNDLQSFQLCQRILSKLNLTLQNLMKCEVNDVQFTFKVVLANVQSANIAKDKITSIII